MSAATTLKLNSSESHAKILFQAAGSHDHIAAGAGKPDVLFSHKKNGHPPK